MAELDKDLFRIYRSVRAFGGHEIALANLMHFYEVVRDDDPDSLASKLVRVIDRKAPERREAEYSPRIGKC